MLVFSRAKPVNKSSEKTTDLKDFKATARLI